MFTIDVFIHRVGIQLRGQLLSLSYVIGSDLIIFVSVTILFESCVVPFPLLLKLTRLFPSFFLSSRNSISLKREVRRGVWDAISIL